MDGHQIEEAEPLLAVNAPLANNNAALLLKELRKSRSDIGKVIQIIGNATSIDLSNVKMKFNQIKVLAAALEFNTTLRWLNLNNNSIGSKGAIVLARALQGNTTLRILNLRGNSIDYSGVANLCNALANNTALVCLDLSNNIIVAKSIARLEQLLMYNFTLLYLGVTDSNKDEQHAAYELSFLITQTYTCGTMAGIPARMSLLSNNLNSNLGHSHSVRADNHLSKFLKRNIDLQLAAISNIVTSQAAAAIRAVTLLPTVIVKLIIEIRGSTELAQLREIEQQQPSENYFVEPLANDQESLLATKQPQLQPWLLTDVFNPNPKKKDWGLILNVINHNIQATYGDSAPESIRKMAEVIASDNQEANKVCIIKNHAEKFRFFTPKKDKLFYSNIVSIINKHKV